MKQCCRCLKTKSLGSFSPTDKTGRLSARCKQCTAQNRLRYYYANKAQEQAKSRVYQEQNRAKVYAQRKEWRKANPDKLANERRSYFRRHPYKIAVYNHRRLALKKATGGSFTEREWLDLCNLFGNACLDCGCIEKPLTVDHITPLSKGGSSNIDNIQPLCGSCNYRKHNKAIDFRLPWKICPGVETRWQAPSVSQQDLTV